MTQPDWAHMQRRLIDKQSEAAAIFLNRYSRSDGSFHFRRHWPGMDGSDDAYEGFQALPLLYTLGGADWLLPTSHRMWLAAGWQFEAYGQVHRWFDGYYDWMHHGEASMVLFHLGLADPRSLIQRDQAIRFAAMYNGDDPSVDNWDAERRMIRSPFNGSRGPRYELTEEDWSTHREDLSQYHPPFEDLPDAELDAACSWVDERMFTEILKRANDRWTRGDVPINLTATSLGAHAYLWTGEDKYRRWVVDYLDAWVERASRNGGLCPDNVGPNDVIGELNDRRWWGGYYGWWWPHGPHVLIEAITIACANAALLDGDLGRLDLARTQLDLVMEMARPEGDRLLMPNRYGARGWDDYSRNYATVIFDPRSAIAIWELSRSDADRDRVRALIGSKYETTPSGELTKGNLVNGVPYFRYRDGENPDYPDQAFAAIDESIDRRVRMIAADHAVDEDVDMHHWQLHSPVVCEPIVQTSLGASMSLYHGGLLHAPIRHFDGLRRRPGLPEGVAVLVDEVRSDAVSLNAVNTGGSSQQLIVQAGCFGEHRFGDSVMASVTGGDPISVAVTGERRWLRLELPPGCNVRMTADMRRYCARPDYASPFVAAADFAPTIVPRTALDRG